MKQLLIIPLFLFLACSSQQNNSDRSNDQKSEIKTEEISESEKEKTTIEKEWADLDTSKCILNFEIGRSSRFESEYPLFQSWDEKMVKARDFSNSKGLWYFNNKELKAGSKDFLLAVDTSDKSTWVNASYFSDLMIVNATNLADSFVLGNLKPALFSKLNPKEIILFLVRSEIIKTYIHLNAEICLKKENNEGDVYTAGFFAVHHYCTNKCHDTPYKFSVSINKKTGLIFVKP